MANTRNTKTRSTAQGWKGKVGEGQDVELPSGNVALVKKVAMQELLAGDVIPDSLSPIVNQAIQSKKGLPPAKLQATLADREGIFSLMVMLDRITCEAVVDPKVFMPPTCKTCDQFFKDNPDHKLFDEGKGGHLWEEVRDPDVLYADDIDLNDKLFIFNYAVGGTGDLKRFREQHEKSVERLLAGEDMEQETQ